MKISLKRENEAYEILKSYDGENPYLLYLKMQVFVEKNTDLMNNYNLSFILQNKNTEPKHINKIIRVADWWADEKKEKWHTDFLPNRIKIISYLGENDTSYVCYAQYRKSVPEFICHIPKKAVLTDFLVKDYKKIEVDFDRYDRLSNFKRILYPHQKDAVKFLLARKKCILADSPGLGKTTSLTVAAIEGNFDSILVVCPASLKTNWKNELSFYVPEKDLTVIDGFNDKTKGELEVFLGYAEGKSGLKKDELLKEAKDMGKWKFNRFVIINYDILDEFYKFPSSRSNAAFEEAFSKSPLLQYITNRKSLIIIDEAQALSNPKSNRYKIIRGLIRKGKPDSVYLATGTPVTNNPQNLFSVLDLLETPITADYQYYMTRYCNSFEMVHPKDKEKKKRLTADFLKKKGALSIRELTDEEKNELHDLIHKHCKFMLIANDKTTPQNLDELKDRISHIYLRRTKDNLELPEKTIHEVYYRLTDEQQDQYERLWEEYEEEQSKKDPEKELNKNLLEGSIYRQYLADEMVHNTIKLANKIIDEGRKVVIACCYDNELYTLKEHYGDKCVIFNGKMSLKQKDDAVAAFMGDDNVKVFVGNAASASVGITLTSSNCLIFNDIDYVPSVNLQFEDRVHRIGQTKPVDIYYQIFKNTQYEKMWKIVIRKQTVIDAIIKSEEEK